MRTWIALVLLAACSHGAGAPKSAQTMPLAAGASCDQMATHVVQIMPGGADGSSGDAGKKVAAVLQERCTADAWSPQARECLYDLKALREADTCKQYLSKVQIDAADKQMDAAMPMAEPPNTAADRAEPNATETPPPPPPAGTRGPKQKKKESSKSSGDPCMGGE